jgi:hypothetical protein
LERRDRAAIDIFALTEHIRVDATSRLCWSQPGECIRSLLSRVKDLKGNLRAGNCSFIKLNDKDISTARVGGRYIIGE